MKVRFASVYASRSSWCSANFTWLHYPWPADVEQMREWVEDALADRRADRRLLGLRRPQRARRDRFNLAQPFVLGDRVQRRAKLNRACRRLKPGLEPLAQAHLWILTLGTIGVVIIAVTVLIPPSRELRFLCFLTPESLFKFRNLLYRDPEGFGDPESDVPARLALAGLDPFNGPDVYFRPLGNDGGG